MEAKNLADLYDLPTLDWSAVEAGLHADITQAPGTGGPNRHTFWLATINPDGTPHVNGIGAEWAGGAVWCETGGHAREGRSLAGDPRCTVSIATEQFDLVVEGEAEMITDPATVAKMAAVWAAGGWPAKPDETGQALTAEFSAP